MDKSRSVSQMNIFKPPPHINQAIQISVAITLGRSIWRHVLTSASTHHMTILTPSSFFCLYPKDLQAKTCMVRATDSHVKDALYDSNCDRAESCGLKVIRSNHNAIVPCSSCPTISRQLVGARGISEIVWCPSVGGLHDTYEVWIVTKFFGRVDRNEDTLYNSWVFSSVCYNQLCTYFTGFPTNTTPIRFRSGAHGIVAPFPAIRRDDPIFQGPLQWNRVTESMLSTCHTPTTYMRLNPF